MKKPEFRTVTFGESDADTIVRDHPEWFAGAHATDARPGTLDYYGAHHVGVHIVHPEKGNNDPQRDGIVIVPRSYEAMFGPFSGDDTPFDLEAKRDAVIANILNKTVVGVDTPGFGMNPDAKPDYAHMREASVYGSMIPHTYAQLEAIMAALKDQGIYDPNIESMLRMEFVGYSMGNIAVVDMMHQLPEFVPNPEVTGLMMVEPVNDQKFGLIGDKGLLAAIGRETNQPNTDRYFAQNVRNDLPAGYDREAGDNFGDFNPGRRARQEAAKKQGSATNLSIGAGMRKPFAPRLAQQLAAQPAIDVDMVRTNGSEVARREQNARTAVELAQVADRLAATTVLPTEDEPDHHHPIWQSLPGTAAIVSDRAARRQSR